MPRKTGFPCCPSGSHYLCHYAHHWYKTRYACFRCRKAFKRRDPRDLDPGAGIAWPRCLECGGEVHDMGVGFHPPRREQVKQWRRLEELAASGAKLLCCRVEGQPRGPLELRELLARQRRFAAR